MISNLRNVARRVAGERKMDWHSGMEKKFWALENDLKNKRMTREEAVQAALGELRIEKKYDKHYKEIEDSIAK